MVLPDPLIQQVLATVFGPSGQGPLGNLCSGGLEKHGPQGGSGTMHPTGYVAVLAKFISTNVTEFGRPAEEI
jgi:hypothetical protein